jgi:hypothetical protein
MPGRLSAVSCADYAEIFASWVDLRADEGKDTGTIDSTPMQAFVANLTAALLFIHTVFGCCWHHAHACEHALTAAVTQPSKCCHHHHHESDSKHEHKPGKCKSDCEGTCNYVLQQKVTIEAPQWVANDVLTALPTLAGQQIEAAASWEAAPSLSDLALPLRTHLLHQVLLN